MRRNEKSRLSTRRGVTLFEVLLATTIFATATAVLSQLAQRGIVAASRADFESEASLRCENILQHLRSGIRVPRSHLTSSTDGWSSRIETVPESTELTLVVITVSNDTFDESFEFQRVERIRSYVLQDVGRHGR